MDGPTKMFKSYCFRLCVFLCRTLCMALVPGPRVSQFCVAPRPPRLGPGAWPPPTSDPTFAMSDRNSVRARPASNGGERPMWPSEPCARYAHAGNPATSREGAHNRMKNTRFCNISVNHFASEDRCNGKTDVSPSPQWTLPVTTGDACPRGPSSSAFHPSQPATDARGAQAPAWRLADLPTC